MLLRCRPWTLLLLKCKNPQNMPPSSRTLAPRRSRSTYYKKRSKRARIRLVSQLCVLDKSTVLLLILPNVILQAKMFADNFVLEHQVSGKHKSFTKDQIAIINFCKLLVWSGVQLTCTLSFFLDWRPGARPTYHMLFVKNSRLQSSMNHRSTRNSTRGCAQRTGRMLKHFSSGWSWFSEGCTRCHLVTVPVPYILESTVCREGHRLVSIVVNNFLGGNKDLLLIMNTRLKVCFKDCLYIISWINVFLHAPLSTPSSTRTTYRLSPTVAQWISRIYILGSRNSLM